MFTPARLGNLGKHLEDGGTRAFPGEEIQLGLTWDLPAGTSALKSQSARRIELIPFPPLGERSREVAGILEQFHRTAGLREEKPSLEGAAWVETMVENRPKFGTMRLMKALARGPELWRYLRDRGW